MIQLPDYVTAKHVSSVLDAATACSACADQEIVLDASNVRFVDPVGLCLLAEILAEAASYGQTVKVRGANADVHRYLQRMNVFAQLGVDEPEDFVRHDRPEALHEVTLIADQDAADRSATALTGTIVQNLNLPDEGTGDGMHATPKEYAETAILYLLSETLSNALEHSGSHGHGAARRWVAAQRYRHERVSIAVVDTGCGLLRSLSRHPRLQAQTHSASIYAALTPRVSCNVDVDLGLPGTKNQGMGLTFVQDLVHESNGRFTLVTGDAHYVSSAHGQRMVTTPHWQGTILVAELVARRLTHVRIAEIAARYDRGNDIDSSAEINFI